MRPTYSLATLIMRIAVSLALGLIICGCAHEAEKQQQPQGWQRAPPVPACLSDTRYRGPSEGTPMVLEAKFKAQLLQQLDQNRQTLREPFCWYEISGSEVLLVAASQCNCPVDFYFRSVASNWSLARVEVRLCDTRCDELNNIRIDPSA